MGTATLKQTWIQLRMGDPSVAGVTLHAENGDVSALGKQMIARAGRLAAQIQEFDEQLIGLRSHLEAWGRQRADLLQESYLILKGDHFLFLVVLKGQAFNAALEDELTALDIAVAQNPDYSLINLSVLALPAFAEDAIRSFLPHRIFAEAHSSDAERTEPPVARKS